MIGLKITALLLQFITTISTFTYVPYVNLSQYQGLWYQVYGSVSDYTFEGINSRCVQAEYKINDCGNISVVNSELRNNKYQNINGVAFYEEGNYGGDLSLIFNDLPTDNVGSYWIVELGPLVENMYDYSIVSDNNQFTLFVLSRDVDKFFKIYDNDVLISLENMGFTKEYNKPIITNQTNC